MSQTTHNADIFKTLNFCILIFTHLKKEKFYQIYVDPDPQVLRFPKLTLIIKTGISSWLQFEFDVRAIYFDNQGQFMKVKNLKIMVE